MTDNLPVKNDDLISSLVDTSSGLDEKTVAEAFRYLRQLCEPSISELGGVPADQIKHWRWKNRINIAIKAKKYLDKKGISPASLPPSLMVPLLEQTSLKDDENLQDMWAALLAKASDSSKPLAHTEMFIHILSQLSPMEARVLNELYRKYQAASPDEKREALVNHGDTMALLKLTGEDFGIILQKLEGLNLFMGSSLPSTFTDFGDYQDGENFTKHISFSVLGETFVKHCRLG